MCRWIVLGIVSIITGAGLLAAEMVMRFNDQGPAEASAALGAGLLLFGAMTLYTRWLLRMMQAVNRPADEAYTDGHGVGFDKGWRECARELRPKVIRLDNRRERTRQTVTTL